MPVPPLAPAPAQLVPVAPQERVQLFDVLRGFCLFGVLWSNLNDWYITQEPATAFDHALQWTQEWLVESRLYSLLGLLFGIGFAIQLTRAAQRGQDGRRVFLRRMATLLGVGLVHALLIWHGDILADYALAGFALTLFWRLSPRKLLLAAVALWLLYPYVLQRLAAVLNISLPNYGAAWRQLNDLSLQVYAHGTWAQAVAQGTAHYWGWLYRSLLLGGTTSFLALFVLGLWMVRVDLIARLTRRRSYILWALLGALVCWGGFTYIDTTLLEQWWPPLNSPATWHELRFWWPRRAVFTFVGDVAIWANAAVYALLFALTLSFPPASKRLESLAALGRMTLTAYLMQSLVCTVLFYHWGFGLMNKVNLTGIFIFTVSLFALQIAFSVWWFKRYRFGPAEWLWRSLAYGRRLPMRMASVQPAPVAMVASRE